MVNSGSFIMLRDKGNKGTIKSFKHMTIFEEILNSFSKSLFCGFPKVFIEDRRQAIRSRALVRGKGEKSLPDFIKRRDFSKLKVISVSDKRREKIIEIIRER